MTGEPAGQTALERLRTAAVGPPPQGAVCLGTSCAYVPAALLAATGKLPWRLRAQQQRAGGTDLADVYMGRVTCSYTRCMLEAAEDGCFAGLAGMVFTTGCDAMRRLHDNLAYLQPASFLHMLDLPHKTTPEAIGYYRNELRTLADRLRTELGVDLEDDALRAAMRDQDRKREQLEAIDALRTRPRPPLTGADMISICNGAASLPVGEAADLLGKLRQELDAAPERAPARARLVLATSQLDDPAWLDALESSGALVVGEVGCTTMSACDGPAPEDDDPYRAMAAASLGRFPCPRMMESFQQLHAALGEMVRTREAHGVVIACMKFCDPWGIQGALLARALRQDGIPVLRLEREYFLSGEGQIATRVQAFMESMGR